MACVSISALKSGTDQNSKYFPSLKRSLNSKSLKKHDCPVGKCADGQSIYYNFSSKAAILSEFQFQVKLKYNHHPQPLIILKSTNFNSLTNFHLSVIASISVVTHINRIYPSNSQLLVVNAQS
jgi:hypothetical protein